MSDDPITRLRKVIRDKEDCRRVARVALIGMLLVGLYFWGLYGLH